MIRDSVIIRAVRDALTGQTTAAERVFAWRESPLLGNSPFINIVIDEWIPDRDNSRGAYKTTRRLGVILSVGNGDAEDESPAPGNWVLDHMDDLTDQVLNIMTARDFNLGIREVSTIRLARVVTERKDKDRKYAKRFLLFEILTMDRVNG